MVGRNLFAHIPETLVFLYQTFFFSNYKCHKIVLIVRSTKNSLYTFKDVEMMSFFHSKGNDRDPIKYI